MLNQMNRVGDSNIPGIFVSTKEELKEKWRQYGIQAVYLTSQPEVLREIKRLGGASIYLELMQKNKVSDEEKIDEGDAEWRMDEIQTDSTERSQQCYEADYIWQMSDETDLPDSVYIHRVWQRHMHLPWLIAETRRLIIRESVMEDLPYFQQFYEEEKDNPDVQQLCEGEEQLGSYITTRYPLFEYGLWTIVDKATGVVLGRAGIEELPENYGSMSGEPELSYLIGKNYRCRGISTEACQAILRYAAEELEMKRIYLRTSKSNLPSQKLAEKLRLLKVESITEYKDLLYCGLLTFEE